MMASATSTLVEIYPTYADQILALAGMSETISGITGIYVALFIAIPLCNKLYDFLEARIGNLWGKPKKTQLKSEEI